MGMRSSFNNEYGVFVYDDLLKEYIAECRKNNEVGYIELEEWYLAHDTFSFGMMDGWKLYGYWYDDSIWLIRLIEKFIDWEKVKENGNGMAEFVYEEGNPFRFILDGEKCAIHVEFIPTEWRSMELKSGGDIVFPVNEVLRKVEAKALGAKL